MATRDGALLEDDRVEPKLAAPMGRAQAGHAGSEDRDVGDQEGMGLPLDQKESIIPRLRPVCAVGGAASSQVMCKSNQSGCLFRVPCQRPRCAPRMAISQSRRNKDFIALAHRLSFGCIFLCILTLRGCIFAKLFWNCYAPTTVQVSTDCFWSVDIGNALVVFIVHI